MKNKKNAIMMLAGLLSAGLLSSCGGNTPAATTQTTQATTAVETTTSEAIIQETYTDIDTIDVPSGDYMVGASVYSFDKDKKAMKVVAYADYDSYLAKNGTVNYDGAVRFVTVKPIFGNEYNAVYFEVDTAIYLFYQVQDKLVVTIKRGSSSSSGTASPVAEIATFSYGNYISDKQTQNKATEDGSYIYDSEGGLIKEEFYLYLELTADKAAVYLSFDGQTHEETPLHSVEGYKTLILNARLVIRIPHKSDANYNCSLTASGDGVIKFVNSMERKGDYSCSGTFTKLS